jgi:hypothetical protein
VVAGLTLTRPGEFQRRTNVDDEEDADMGRRPPDPVNKKAKRKQRQKDFATLRSLARAARRWPGVWRMLLLCCRFSANPQGSSSR